MLCLIVLTFQTHLSRSFHASKVPQPLYTLLLKSSSLYPQISVFVPNILNSWSYVPYLLNLDSEIQSSYNTTNDQHLLFCRRVSGDTWKTWRPGTRICTTPTTGTSWSTWRSCGGESGPSCLPGYACSGHPRPPRARPPQPPSPGYR